MKIIIELPHYNNKEDGGIKRMITLANKLTFELPYHSLECGGIKETELLAKLIGNDVSLRFQRLTNHYPQIENPWSVGFPDNTFPDTDICITYTDTPYIEELVRLPQVKKVFLYALSYGMAIERERKNVLYPGVTVLCTTKKIEDAIIADGGIVNRVGFGLEMNEMFNENKTRERYLSLLYNHIPCKSYELAVRVADILFQRKLINGVITFGRKDGYKNFNHPIGLVNHYSCASREEVREVFNRSKCFLMPSVSEGLSLTPIESTLCGCPAIICDGAINEVFFNNENCIVTEKNNVELMVETVTNTINSFDQLSHKFEYKMREVVKEFTWDKVIENIKKIL